MPTRTPTPKNGEDALLLTAEAAAARLSISLRSMNTLLSKREVKSVKVGGSRRVPTQALEEYVARLMRDA